MAKVRVNLIKKKSITKRATAMVCETSISDFGQPNREQNIQTKGDACLTTIRFISVFV